LRHERKKLAVRRQVCEVCKRHRGIAELRVEHASFLMRQPEEVVEHAKFVHDFEGRRMNRVTAEVAQKIGVLFEDNNVNTRSDLILPDR
jgi:hypothetical protein